MGSVNGWRAVGDMGVQPMGKMGKTPVHAPSNLFLNILTTGAVTTEAWSLIYYFITLTEKAGPLLLRWLVPWSAL